MTKGQRLFAGPTTNFREKNRNGCIVTFVAICGAASSGRRNKRDRPPDVLLCFFLLVLENM